MLAQFGMIGGRRVLAEAAVRQGTGNLLPPGVKGPAMNAAPADFGAGGRVGIGPEAGIYGWAGAAGKIGRAHVCTPVTNAQLVCRLLLVKKKNTSLINHIS